MLAKLRPRLTYANVVATIALFVAVSTGGAYAANTVFSTDIVDGEVKTPDIQNGAVTTNKLATRAVTSPKVADNNLTANDLAANSVGTSEIATDAVGPPDILNGGVGGDELGAIYPCCELSTSVPPSGGVGSVTAACPEGTRIIGGGASFTFPSGEISASKRTGNAWFGQGQNNGNVAQNLTVKADCLLNLPQTP